jgi:hypothetical protein
MRKLLLITVTMVVLSLLCISPVKAACPDTSYVTFKVTIGTGDCLNL